VVKKILLMLATIILTGAFISIGCPSNPNPPVNPLVITTTEDLPAWIEGHNGSARLTAIGGTKPYKWTFTTGSVHPGWLQINDTVAPFWDGVLSGQSPLLASGVTKSVSPAFSVTCTDANGQKATAEFRVTIIRQSPTITAVPGVMCVGETYSYQDRDCPCVLIATATGGTPPYHFQSDTFRNGAPPLQTVVGTQYVGPQAPIGAQNTGCLTGRAAQIGVFTFGVTVVDSVGQEDSAQTTVSVVPKPKIDFFRANPANINAGETSTLRWNVIGETDAYTITIDPDIGNVDPDGTQVVTPKKTTTYTLTASVGGAKCCSDTKTATVTVIESTHTIITKSDSSCLIIPSGTSASYSVQSFNVIPVPEHSDICFQIISSPVPPPFTENGLECPTPSPTSYCEVYVDGYPKGPISAYCFTDVTEDHTITASAQ
jgi:hypothetical protein